MFSIFSMFSVSSIPPLFSQFTLCSPRPEWQDGTIFRARGQTCPKTGLWASESRNRDQKCWTIANISLLSSAPCCSFLSFIWNISLLQKKIVLLSSPFFFLSQKANIFALSKCFSYSSFSFFNLQANSFLLLLFYQYLLGKIRT